MAHDCVCSVTRGGGGGPCEVEPNAQGAGMVHGTWYRAGSRRQNGTQAPSSAVQQAYREAPATRRGGSCEVVCLRLPDRRSDGCPRAGRHRRRHRSQGMRVRITAAHPAALSHIPPARCGGRWRCMKQTVSLGSECRSNEHSPKAPTRSPRTAGYYRSAGCSRR
jgi:hypothetical protein